MIILVPLVIFIGWSWTRIPKRWNSSDKMPWISIAGLILATLSGLFAIGTICYSGATGGFAYYDPTLLRIYRCGLLISLTALVLGVAGVPFRSPARWQTPLSAFGMLLFWFAAAAME
jgi:hypothetical protein